MNRRYFLMGTGALASTQVKSHMLASPNDTVRIACVGVRGQGRTHLKQYSQMKNVEIAAICDIDESILNSRLDMVEKSAGKKPDSYWEIRKLLEDKSIDAISIATPTAATPCNYLVAAGGQARLLRKTMFTRRLRIEADCRGYQEIREIVQHGKTAGRVWLYATPFRK
jgi:ornithine cyclodeaminase/alanine dehydrogenase-like protein (mu-crystallin family)